MRKYIRYTLIGLAVLIPLSFVAGYGLARSSQPFARAREAIELSPQVRSEIGEVANVRLTFFGYNLRYSGAEGQASFHAVATGAGGTNANVYVALERRLGEWSVSGMRVAP